MIRQKGETRDTIIPSCASGFEHEISPRGNVKTPTLFFFVHTRSFLFIERSPIPSRQRRFFVSSRKSVGALKVSLLKRVSRRFLNGSAIFLFRRQQVKRYFRVGTGRSNYLVPFCSVCLTAKIVGFYFDLSARRKTKRALVRNERLLLSTKDSIYDNSR